MGRPLRQEDYPYTSAQAFLDRLGSDRPSKHSSLSLDLNANENSATEQSGSESIEDGEQTQSSTSSAQNLE